MCHTQAHISSADPVLSCGLCLGLLHTQSRRPTYSSSSQWLKVTAKSGTWCKPSDPRSECCLCIPGPLNESWAHFRLQSAGHSNMTLTESTGDLIVFILLVIISRQAAACWRGLRVTETVSATAELVPAVRTYHYCKTIPTQSCWRRWLLC